MLSCLFLSARGQTEYKYVCWFDDDLSTLQTGTSASDSWQMQVDVSGLKPAVHALHVQVSDEHDISSTPVTRFFMKDYREGTVSGNYWFDDKVEQLHQTPSVQGAFDIDVSSLSDGFHTFFYQVGYPDGTMSPVAHRSFCKIAMPVTGKWYCWFDSDQKTLQSGTGYDDTIILDATDLTDGFHMVSVQADYNGLTTVVTRPFLKIPQTMGVEYMTCLCLVDSKLYKQEQVATNGEVVEWDFDVASLPYGFHSLQLQVVTPSGAASPTYQGFFMRDATREEYARMKCIYSVDGNYMGTTAGTLGNGTFHFDLDVESLEDGLHNLSFMLSDGSGVNTPTQTRFFMKTPLGGNGMTRYAYWLNSQSADEATTVELEQKTDPFSLIQLLPVETQPIRSSCFEFRVKDGKPIVYAKNDIHVRFYDASDRFSDVNRQYVDEQVSEEVSAVGELVTQQEFASVSKNNIRWYTMYSEPGDTVTFKTSQACTIQLFSPTGEEVFSASGSNSVKYDGCHTWEKGTYYLAIHDVMGSNASMTLSHVHLSKYDVVAQDVRLVGNGGESTITYKGNGFDALNSVDLVLGTDTIHSEEIGHESDAETSVKFDFDGAELGAYTAVFHFEDYDKKVANNITVEEALPFEFESSVTFASQYLRGRSNNYVFKIRNNSNMTAYNVPLAIHVYTPDSTSLERIDISGFDMKSHLRSLAGSQYTDSIDKVIDEKIQTNGDLYGFVKKTDATYVPGVPYLQYTFITPTLRPNTTETFTITVKSNNTVYVYMWYPEEWTNQPANRSRKLSRGAVQDGICAIANNRNRMCEENEMLIANGFDPIYNVDCDNLSKPSGNCPNKNGGSSTPVSSLDPNDIYGPTAESGSRFITGDEERLNYTIEFENDPEFATAAAHTVVVRDTLDASRFDLSSFTPTCIKIGDKTLTLNGEQEFVKTIDMRPEINAIAQVEQRYDVGKGIAEWNFISLDPMTMEPTENPMSGFLPVNYNGNGIGEVSYDIKLKPELAHGTEVSNRAGIVFDSNDVILTPTWTNIIDKVAPVGRVIDAQVLNDSVATVNIEASDELSGAWRYDVYVQYGKNASWWKAAEGVPADTTANVKIYEGINHGFYVIVTDSAGNVEQKDAAREFSMKFYTSLRGDVNGDGNTDTQDAIQVIRHYLGKEPENFDVKAADVNGDGNIDTQDAILIIRIYLGKE